MTTTQHVLNAQRVFPIGTSVKAIPQSNWAVNQLPPTADQGSATDTKTVQPDGTLTFTGLTAKTRYFAVATVDSVYRYISFICGDAGDLSAPDAYVTQAQLAAAIAGVGGGAVSSVFGRTGAVAAAEADYGLTQMSDVDLAGQANGNFLKRSSGVWVPAAIAESDVANLVSDLAGKQASLGFTPENVANKDTDVTMAANSDTKYPSQRAAKAYIDAVASGLQVKGSVRLASTANIAGTMVGTVLTVTATGAISIDGVTPSVGDRVLLKNQTTGSQNGVYTVTVVGTTGVSPVLTRATDFIVGVQVQSGDFFFVGEGTANAGAGYVLTTADPITVGTTSLTFTQFSGAGEITAGAGLTKTGNTLDVIGGSGITVAADLVSADPSAFHVTGTHAARLAISSFIAGRLYKETDTGLIYLDTGSAWSLWKSDGFVRKTANETVNNTNTLQNDDELLFPIEANEVWFYTAFIRATSASANADWRFGFTGPTLCAIACGLASDASVVAGGWSNLAPATALLGALRTVGQNNLAGAGAFESGYVIQGWAVNGANAGNVNFQFAQNTATAENSIVNANSFLQIRRLL